MRNNSDYFQLACKILVCRENRELEKEIEKKFDSKETDIFKFVQLCSNNLILPAIYEKLSNTEFIHYFPKDFANHLKEIYDLNTLRNHKILHQINDINYILKQHHIQPIYLKGTANLLDNLYSHPGHRLIGDIDFLVRDEYFIKSIEILKKHGYNNDKKLYDDISQIKEYPKLKNEKYPAVVEIHRMPVDKPFADRFSSMLIFKNKKRIAQFDNCFVPDDKHKIIHTFIHSQLINKGFLFRNIPLRDLYDFYLLSKRITWEDIIIDIEEKRKAQIFYDVIRMLMNESEKQMELMNLKSRQFYTQLNWFLNHPRFHRIYVLFIQFIHLIYFRIIKSLFNKASFRNLYNRIRDWNWWEKRLFPGLRNYFSK